MKAYFNIHGLSLELSADHPLLFETFSEDLRGFRVKKIKSRQKIRLLLTALPASINSDSNLSSFAPYEELASHRKVTMTSSVTCYGRSAITVITDSKKRLIRAGVTPDTRFLPDPTYHLCFTHSASFWFKQRGLFCLHAGCVSSQGQGILIAGPRRSGKSTLSYSAVRSGFKFLSDEQPLLAFRKGQLQALTFPRRVRLDYPVAERFPELQRLPKPSDSERLIFHMEDVWKDSVANTCSPRILVFPKFLIRGPLRITPMGSAETLSRLLQDDHFVWYRNKPWDQISHRHLDLLEKLTSQTSAFSLEYGAKDILRIPGLFIRLLRNG